MIELIKQFFLENRGIKQTVLKNTFWLALAHGFTSFLMFFLFIYAARVFGAAEYGKFTFALSFVSLFVILGDVGMSSIVVREFSKKKEDEKDYSLIISLKLFLGVLAFVFTFLASFFVTDDKVVQLLIWILMFFIFSDGFLKIVYSFAHARQKMEHEALIRIIIAGLTVSAGFFVILKFPSALNLGYVYLFSDIIVLAGTVFYLNYSHYLSKLRFDWVKFINILKNTWPLSLGFVGIGTYINLDSVILGFLGTCSEVGWYNAASKIVLSLIALSAGLISESFYPLLSKFFEESKIKFKKTWKYYMETMVMLAVPVIFVGVLLAGKIISFLYGTENYGPSVLILRLLIIVAGISFLYHPFGTMLVVANKQRENFMIILSCAVLNILLNFILIPLFGFYAAAASTVAVSTIALLAAILFSSPYTGISIFGFLNPSVKKKLHRLFYRICRYFRQKLIAMNSHYIAKKNDRGKYNVFIIWGHGLKNKDAILKIIKDSGFLDIKMEIFYNIKNIARFIRQVYKYDYAPFMHLKNKTNYLLNVEPRAYLIFVFNNDPKEVVVGEGPFMHIECQNLRQIKQKMRDEFNPKGSEEDTQRHIVHASDQEIQVDHLLKYLGFGEGINLLKKIPNPFLSLPYHIKEFSSFKIKKIKFQQLYCRIQEGDAENFSKKICHVNDSPHYKYLAGDKEFYLEYLKTFNGNILKDDHSPQTFDKLFSDAEYLQVPYENSYILTEEIRPGEYVILDGLHRAAKLLFSNQEALLVAVKCL